MLKKLVLLVAVVTAATGNLPGSPNQSPSTHKQQIQDSGPAKAPVTVVVQNDQRSQPAEAPEQKSFPWNTASQCALVIVGIITCCVIGWQSNETRKAAKAAEDSIAMQELALRQWVELSNWKADFISSGRGQPAFMRFRVDIVNSTNFPLTIHQGHLVFAGNTKFFLADEFFMTPRVPYTVDLNIQLSEEQERDFLRIGLWFSICGEMPHISVLGKLFPQPIRGHLNCVNGIAAVWQPEMPTQEEQKAN